MKSTGHFKCGCWTVIVTSAIFIYIACSGDMSMETLFTMLSILIIGFVTAIIFWLIGTAKAVKETFVFVRDSIIDLFTIKREVKQRCPAALRAQILEKKKHSVNVNIFDDSNTIIEKMDISCEGGVSSDIYEGQVIAL